MKSLRGFEADDSELKLRRGSGFLAFLVDVFSQIFGPIVSIRVKTLSKTRLVASRYIKREKVSLPVDLLPVVAQKRLCLNFLWFWTKILTSLIFRHAADSPKFCTF